VTYNIALYPGDGIGPEVVGVTVPVLDTLAEKHGFTLETTRYDWNAAHYFEHGSLMPEDGARRLADADAILHGATGHPDVPEDAVMEPDGHHKVRYELDLFVDIRPAYLFSSEYTPLAGYDAETIDIRWYQENSEGVYTDIGGRLERASETEIAVQTGVFTRKGIERVVKLAFESAESRDGKLTSVTKSNSLRHTHGFWDEIVAEIAPEYPTVDAEHLFVDAAALHLVRRPEEFDVVVAPNLVSDILTDLTAGLVGGLGLAPSANLNPDGDVPGMFEPIHGSAPDIAGQGIANPLAMILSAAMMLDDLDESEAAADLRRCISAQLDGECSPKTADLDGNSSTEEVAADLDRRIRESASPADR
jgi:tartrate dehydrogenase/decarboxylase/D-malate dehydrogenase